MAEKGERTQSPPKLYDLTTLQRDANRIFSFTAKQTLDCLQSLYEKRLVTYPRTDSCYLTDSMGKTAEDVIKAVCSHLMFENPGTINPDTGRILDSRRVTDHHAIIPTMEIVKTDLRTVPESEMRVLSLIAARLICAVSEEYVYMGIKAEISCGGGTFLATGKRTVSDGWRACERKLLDSCQLRDTDEEEPGFMDLSEGMELKGFTVETAKVFTKPKPHYTEDSLLSAMEHAGTEGMEDGVERKGLGTPATRAEIIEKLVNDGLVRREKRSLIPTFDGIRLITVLPEELASPRLTTDWENMLAGIASGEVSPDSFMEGVEDFVRNFVAAYSEVGGEGRDRLPFGHEVLGACPKCGKDVAKGRFGIYCTGRCGMAFDRAYGKELSQNQVKRLLSGKKILLKGLVSRAGHEYNAYFIPTGTEDYSYVKDGAERTGSRFRFKMEFARRKDDG